MGFHSMLKKEKRKEKVVVTSHHNMMIQIMRVHFALVVSKFITQ